VSIRKSYGFRSFDTLELALYHAMGDLPMPKHTRRFC
jgi:transposase